MIRKKMGQGQNRKLKADYGRDKSVDPTQEERRELASRHGSSKKPKVRKALHK